MQENKKKKTYECSTTLFFSCSLVFFIYLAVNLTAPLSSPSPTIFFLTYVSFSWLKQAKLVALLSFRNPERKIPQ